EGNYGDTPRIGRVSVAASDGSTRILEVRQATLSDYKIGQIPAVKVEHGTAVQFLVHADERWPQATLSAELPQNVTGSIAFDPQERRFTYSAAIDDRESFSVLFKAGTEADTLVQQQVWITPYSRETEVLSRSQTEANPEDRDYILRRDLPGNTTLMWNHEERTTYKASVHGKRLVFEPDHPNGLYEAYNGDKDLEILDLHADTLIIRAPLHLPQTQVTIRARELRFEDRIPEQPASISTTPDSFFHRPDDPVSGAPGLKGGEIAVNIESFHFDPGTETRFILKGGQGQAAGQGRKGDPGDGTDPIRDFHGCPYPNNTIYAHVIFWGWLGDRNDRYAPSGYNDKTFPPWPGDGDPGIPGGKPGDGGNGGNFSSTLELSSFVDNSGGLAGALADTARGGEPGQPNPAYRMQKRNDDWWPLDHEGTVIHYSSPGPDTPPPPPDKPVGDEGSITYIDNPLSWLTPGVLKLDIAHARDTFRYGHLEEAASALRTYAHLLDDYQSSVYWQNLPDDDEWKLEFEQMRSEIRVLLLRLDSNLDFYGNPAGWVPMLSFEVTKTAFENEIDRAIRVYYLSYWLQNSAFKYSQKVQALEETRGELKEEIGQLKTRYGEAVATIPDLRDRAQAIQVKTDSIQVLLQRAEKRLLEQAKHNLEVPFWKQAFRTIGSICTMVPLMQPQLGLIGEGLNIVANIDFNDPLPTVMEVGKKAVSFYNQTWGATGDQPDPKPAPVDTTKIEDSPLDVLRDVKEAADPYVKSVQTYISDMKKMQAPRSELESEILKLKSRDAEFNRLAEETGVLLARKDRFFRELSDALNLTAELPNRITEDLLAVDALKRDIAAGHDNLDQRVLMHIKDMEHRSRARLLKYQYYMARAYEYRMLESYPGALDLDRLFDRAVTLVDSLQSSALEGRSPGLKAEEFESLKTIYEEDLATVIENIYTRYINNPPELSAPIQFDLSQEELGSLNAGLPLTINMMDRGLFPSSEENVRIRKLAIKKAAPNTAGGAVGSYGFFTIYMEHSGSSMLRKGAKNYLFRHYNKDTQKPLAWGGRWQNGEITGIEPSEASASLLTSLLERRGLPTTSDKLLLYSRPGAWADITITKEVVTASGADMQLDSLRLEVQYDYERGKRNLTELRIHALNDLRPRVKIDAPDLNQRQDGTLAPVLYRIYSQGQKVTLTAPENLGRWHFEEWINRAGGSLTTSPSVTLTMDAHQEVRAKYALLPWHFTYKDRTGDSHAILVESAAIDGIPLENGDEIGVFTPDGLCAGAAIWDGEKAALTVWADDSQSPEIDGFPSGEKLNFRVWDRSLDSEGGLRSAVYVEGDSLFGAAPATVVKLAFAKPDTTSPIVTQTIPLPAGWSWISFNVEPEDPSIPEIMSACKNLVLMQDGDGQTYWPAYDVNDIGNVDIRKGYKVYLSAPDTVAVQGVPADPGTPIPMRQGWNFVSCLTASSMPVESAFDNIAGHLKLVSSDAGRFYFPDYEFDNIGHLNPGKGYKLYLSAPDTLVYDLSTLSGKVVAAREVQNPTPRHFSFASRTGEIYSLLVSSAEGLVNGDEIGLFTQDGDCVGAGVWQGRPIVLAAWMDDTRTPEKDGWKPEDSLIFRVWDPGGNRTSEPAVTYTEGSGSPGEEPGAVVHLSARAVPTEYALSPSYPNPFNPSTTIRYALPEEGRVSLIIFNVSGQQVRTLVGEWQQAGNYTVYWDGKDGAGREVGSGIYLCRMESGAFTRVSKMVLIK
ncbi:MAG: T9SS type A sorting domain-containing protein, partial [Gemmatimonadetes bacterium]|nr:T9SS type A sorting domain-containing protein [Gemmatimonadota bacterium]